MILIKTGYLIGSLIIGGFFYFWLGGFKKVQISSLEELNEGEEELFNDEDAAWMRKVSIVLFVFLSMLIWSIMTVTVGRIAADLTDHSILKWVGYILMYFIFLRIPYGTLNSMIKFAYDVTEFPERILISITIIGFYVMSICCYEQIFGFLKWHLFLLD